VDEMRRALNKALVRIQCQEIRDFVESTSEALENARQRLADYVEQTAQAIEDEGERYGFEDMMGEKGWKLAHDHPQRVFEACFVEAYFYLEDRMCALAQSEWAARGAALEISDLKRQGVEGAKLVLKKVCGYTLLETHESREIAEYKFLRDCIVHRRGRIGKDERLNRYVDLRDLRAQRLPAGRIELNHKFCVGATEVIGQYLEQLIDALT
jgi:hypothetical protein